MGRRGPNRHERHRPWQPRPGSGRLALGPLVRLAVLAGVIATTSACQDAALGSTAPEALTPPGGSGGVSWTQRADPSLAVDPETGELVMAWAGSTLDEAGHEVWNLYVARSTDGGETFAPGVRVNDVPGDLHPHAEGAPRLVAGPGTLALFWNNRVEAEGRRFAGSDMRFSRSTDGGLSWSPATSLQDPLAPATLPPRAHTFHGATWVGTSTLVVAWLDGRDRDQRRLDRAAQEGIPMDEAARTPERFAQEHDPRDGDATVFAAVSHDGGATWEPGNRRIAGATCPCCRVSLVAAPDGSVLGSWRRHFDGSIRDPVVARFEVGAGVAGPNAESLVHPIHRDGWVFLGCPHSGPGLDLGADGTLHAAWYTGAEGRLGVHYARASEIPPHGGDPSGAEGPAVDLGFFSAPLPVVAGDVVGIAHPAVVGLPDGGAVVATNVDAEGERVIVLARISPEGEVAERHRIPGSEGGTHPQLVRIPGEGVVAAWTVSRDGVQEVQMVRFPIETPRVLARSRP